jgi:hypothetical protein
LLYLKERLIRNGKENRFALKPLGLFRPFLSQISPRCTIQLSR